MSVYDMSMEEFKAELSDRTTPDKVFENAPEVYDYLEHIFQESCGDSVLREWAFQWYSESTGEAYDSIYNQWLNN